MSLAAKLDSSPSRSYVVLGDGEIQEGQIWEAAMFGGDKHVDNLVAIVDYNRIQLDGFVERHHAAGTTGRQVARVQLARDRTGRTQHSRPAIRFRGGRQTKGKPTAVIAHTIKGKGVSFMENNPKFHGTAPTQEEMKKALMELA